MSRTADEEIAYCELVNFCRDPLHPARRRVLAELLEAHAKLDTSSTASRMVSLASYTETQQ